MSLLWYVAMGLLIKTFHEILNYLFKRCFFPFFLTANGEININTFCYPKKNFVVSFVALYEVTMSWTIRAFKY